eukprot:6351447-Amphidinium_carterae.1
MARTTERPLPPDEAWQTEPKKTSLRRVALFATPLHHTATIGNVKTSTRGIFAPTHMALLTLQE